MEFSVGFCFLLIPNDGERVWLMVMMVGLGLKRASLPKPYEDVMHSALHVGVLGATSAEHSAKLKQWTGEGCY